MALFGVVARPSHAQTIVEAWGAGGDGELGNGTTNNSSIPVPVSFPPGGVTAVAGGDGQNLAIENNAAYAWGYDGYGELGNGSTANSSTPVAVSGLGVRGHGDRWWHHAQPCGSERSCLCMGL